jgi:hypothetical protein
VNGSEGMPSIQSQAKALVFLKHVFHHRAQNVVKSRGKPHVGGERNE